MNDFTLLKKYRFDVISCLLFLGSLPFFYYKLGQSSLVSWDEAWYAVVARNILRTGDLFLLHFNNQIFYDHPPAGFWLIALTFNLFGISEFWDRFAPATCGFISLFLVYFLGKELFNRRVGFFSATGLISAYWFLYRARSGNLDTILTMFFILTLLLALRTLKNRWVWIPFFVSLTFLCLTKTIVGFTIVVPLLIVYWGKWKQMWQGRFFVGVGLVFWIVVMYLWLHAQTSARDDFFRYYFHIGLPGVEAKTSYIANIGILRKFLHDGVGKWFWPGISTTFFSLVIFKRNFLIVTSFIIAFCVPFVFSDRGQIWHLVPVFPFLILIFFAVIDWGMQTFFDVIAQKKILKIPAKKYQLLVSSGIMLVMVGICFYISYGQMKREWYEFVDIPAYISDEAILSREAGKYPYPYLIDGDYLPAAVFYSGKNSDKIYDIQKEFQQRDHFVLMVQNWRLNSFGIKPSQYTIVKQDRDKWLVVK